MYILNKDRRALGVMVFFSIILFCTVLFYTMEEEERPAHLSYVSLNLPGGMLPFVLSVDGRDLFLTNYASSYWPELNGGKNLFFLDWGEEGESQGWGPFSPVLFDVEPSFSMVVYDYEEMDGTIETFESYFSHYYDDLIEEPLVVSSQDHPFYEQEEVKEDLLEDVMPEETLEDTLEEKPMKEEHLFVDTRDLKEEQKDLPEKELKEEQKDLPEKELKEEQKDLSEKELKEEKEDLPEEEIEEEIEKEKELLAKEEKVEEEVPKLEFITHKVQPGETLWNIARQYGIDVDTIVGANSKLENANHLSIGQELQILSKKGIIHEVYRGETLWEISHLYNVSVDNLVEANNLSSAGVIRAGDSLFIPGVSPTQRPVRYMWPVDGPISSYFGPRWGRMHEGIDIVVPVGTSVRATRSGRVTVSGWVGAYGYVVYIDHGNGVSSRYAHNSRLLVRPGEFVTQGQVIALSGSTGQSTGPHVHFEIRDRGVAINPLNYLPRR